MISRFARLWASACLATPLAAACAPWLAAQQPASGKRVEVAPLDQLAVQQSVEETFGGHYDLGKGIAELLRRRLDELGLGSAAGDAADGRVEGTIVFFGKESARGEAGGVSVGGIRVGLGRRREVALVVLEARLIDVRSGTLVTSQVAEGKSDRGGWDIAARARRADLATFDLSGDAFKKSALGEATHAAVDRLARAIAEAAPPLGTFEIVAPSAAAAAPASPAAAGGLTGAWIPYQFRGTEHFRYDIRTVEDGAEQRGFYQLDLEPAGERRVRIAVQGRLGEDAYSSTITTGVGTEGMQVGMGQLMALGPIGITLLNPAMWLMVAGRELAIGDGWTYASGGESVSVQVERACEHAGKGGSLVVFRENQEVRSEACLAPGVPLPLRMLFREDDQSVVEMTLTSYRP